MTWMCWEFAANAQTAYCVNRGLVSTSARQRDLVAISKLLPLLPLLPFPSGVVMSIAGMGIFHILS